MYLSVVYGRVVSTIKIDFDQTISVERDQLIGILATFLPETDFDEFIGGGLFLSNFSLKGNLSEKETVTNSTTQGEFHYPFTLPEEILDIEGPFEIPEKCECGLFIKAFFDWSPSLAFTTVNLFTIIILDGKEIEMNQTQIDFIPNGAFILWFDKE